MRVFQLNISPGGVPKLPIREAHCSTLGLEGDGHAHPAMQAWQRDAEAEPKSRD